MFCLMSTTSPLPPSLPPSSSSRLHLHNISLRKQQEAAGSRVGGHHPPAEGGGYVSQFGFPCQTSCGLIPMPNDWSADWVVS